MSNLSRPQTLDLRAVINDEGAFREWYADAGPRILAYLLRRVGSRALAEDLMHDVFVEVLRKPGNFDGRADSIPWLIGIARHRLARYVRDNRRERHRNERLADEVAGADPAAVWLAVESLTAIHLALEGMPLVQRRALAHRYLDQRSVRDVARELARSEDATESLIRRARKAFERGYLEAIDAGGSPSGQARRLAAPGGAPARAALRRDLRVVDARS